MPTLTWSSAGSRQYEIGIDHGVLYPQVGAGVAWNGLTSITETASGAEVSSQYADNKKYAVLLSPEEFGGTIEAFIYPDEFERCDGSRSASIGLFVHQQPREKFGLSYRTRIGNDTYGDDYGYKIHIVYNALAAPSEAAYSTTNDSPEALAFSWEFSTTPVSFNDTLRPSAHVIIDSRKISPDQLTRILSILYGTETTAPRLPLPTELIEAVSNYTIIEDYNDQGLYYGTAFVENSDDLGTYGSVSNRIVEDSTEPGTFNILGA